MSHRSKLPDWWPAMQVVAAGLHAKLDILIRATTAERTDLMAFIDDLEASVSREKTVDDSVLALLTEIHKALSDAGVDPARQAAVLAALQGEQDRITAAVTANTPAAPV